jgi:hypothetical protein
VFDVVHDSLRWRCAQVAEYSALNREVGAVHDDTTVSPPRDHVALLGQVQHRVAALVGDQPEAALTNAVPVLDVDVRDLVAHLAGVAVDALLTSAPSCDPDTLSRHVTARAGRELPELLEEWESAVRELLPALAAQPQLASSLLVDAVTHEHDLRTALDQPGCRDDDSVLAVLDVMSDALSERVECRGLPAIRITVEQWGTIAGRPPALRCLVADRFDFVRGMAGRRSARQVERWNWDAAPGAYVEVLSAGALPATDVRERDPRVPDHMRDFDLRH